VIIDFLSADTSDFDADLCIIGGGVAAYTLISSLHNSPLRILVIERGGLNPGPDHEKEKESEITGHTFTGHLEGRYFGLGGTSEYWGGQALPLDEFDFSKKDWVEFSGWPIPFEEIKPFYPEAEKLFKVDHVSFEADVFTLRKLKPLSLDPSSVKFHFSKWSPRPNFKPALIDALVSNERSHILLNAVVSTLEYNIEKKKVSQIHFECSNGRRGTVKATNFILASGGIENARLLLCSPTIPQNKWIGRMFQDHPTAQVATLLPTDMSLLQRYFGYFFIGRTRCLPRLSLSSDIQTSKKLIAATAFIQFLPKEGSLFESMKEVYRSISRMKIPSKRMIVNLFISMRNLKDVIPIMKAYSVNRSVYVPDSLPRLTVMIEQVPSSESHISLSSERDKYGMAKAKINWCIPDATIHTLKEFCLILEVAFQRIQLGNIQWETWLSESNEIIKKNLSDAFHHMGTTRMGQSETTGVVDENCRMHGVGNLYIAGSSVFPTSGHSNPTLTFMALAIRLGRHLEAQLPE